MSRADDMFLKLHYVIEEDNPVELVFKNVNSLSAIVFAKDFEAIRLVGASINMQELKAINEKIKELEWLDD